MATSDTFSFTKGYSFSFEENGKEIVAWFSALSGLEKVFVDGELIVSQRNLSARSATAFRIGHDEYATNMQAVSLVKGPFICTLNKNGRPHKRQKLVFPRAELGFLKILLYLALGVLVGMFSTGARDLLALPGWSVWPILIGMGGLSLWAMYRLGVSKKPVIEDEDIP